MKYLFLFLFPFTSTVADAQCSSFDDLLKKGNNCLKGTRIDYQEAINAYTAAILACPDRANEAKQSISKMVNDINRLRENAVLAEKKATVALADLEKALADIRAKNITTFESFARLSADLIYTLNHAEALEKIKVAVDIEVDAELKRQQLTEPISELLYFFAESGLRLELARRAAELLLQLEPGTELILLLRQCLNENWNNRKQFAPLLKKLPFFHKFQVRYYPELATVPLGTDGVFEMGSDSSEWGRDNDEQLHQVKLTAYQITVTLVTFYQFALYSEATDRSLTSRTPYWGRFGDHPVVNVNWYEAVEYANWLNTQLGLPAVYQIKKEVNSDLDNQVQNDYLKWKVDWNNRIKGYRLPTEAEWELAARGGVGAPKTIFAGSDTLDNVGWYWKNSGDKPLSGNWDLNRVYDNNGRTHPVKVKKDNGIGIYDMSGNVWEWCWDWYSIEYYANCNNQGIVHNPTGPESSTGGRVLRGGRWDHDAEYCRVANRFRINPDYRENRIGFRLVFVP